MNPYDQQDPIQIFNDVNCIGNEFVLKSTKEKGPYSREN